MFLPNMNVDTTSIYKSILEKDTFNISTNITGPTEALRFTFQFVSGFFSVLELYLFFSLLIYEVFAKEKPTKGIWLRILGICATFSSIMYGLLVQLMVAYSNNSTTLCFALLLMKTTVQNIGVSFTYSFIWLRQYKLYASKKFKDLRGKKMKIVTWITLALIFVNPFLMFGFQFLGELYVVENNVCLVQRMSFNRQLPFIFISFIYALIQVSFLLFLLQCLILYFL